MILTEELEGIQNPNPYMVGNSITAVAAKYHIA